MHGPAFPPDRLRLVATFLPLSKNQCRWSKDQRQSRLSRPRALATSSVSTGCQNDRKCSFTSTWKRYLQSRSLTEKPGGFSGYNGLMKRFLIQQVACRNKPFFRIKSILAIILVEYSKILHKFTPIRKDRRQGKEDCFSSEIILYVLF